jgi:hypothetical protein
MEISSTVALVSLITFFIALSLTIIFTGVWISLKYGERVDGWSDTIAAVCIVFMTVVTLHAMNKLQNIFPIPDFGGLYTGLVIGYFLLFVIIQPRIVHYFRQRK